MTSSHLCRSAVACALCGLFALAASEARANVFDKYGFGPRGLAMGGAQTASAKDFAAVYFNPSLLAIQNKASIGADFNWIDHHLRISPEDGQSLDFRNPDDALGWALGFVFPVGGKVQNRLALGVGLYLPAGSVMRAESIDPSIPYWYMHESGNDLLAISVGAGVRITDWLSLGLGIQVLGGIDGDIEFGLNASDIKDIGFSSRDFRADLTTAIAPTAGITFDLKSLGLRFAVGYRGELQVDYRIPTLFHVLNGTRGELASIEFLVSGTVHYSPHTISFGAQWQIIEPLLLSVEARYAFWSRAPDPTVNAQFTVRGGDALKDAFGGIGEDLQEVLNDMPVPVSGKSVDPQFSNTLSLHFGAEYWFVQELFAFRAGYAFKPTPVPLQNGSTNLLDGNTHALSLGAGLYFRDPLEIFAERIGLEFAYQMSLIPERAVTKPDWVGLPNYTYGGLINAFSVALRYAF